MPTTTRRAASAYPGNRRGPAATLRSQLLHFTHRKLNNWISLANWQYILYRRELRPSKVRAAPTEPVMTAPRVDVHVFTQSAATLSWIDPKAGLWKSDTGVPASKLSKDEIMSADICRFSNLLTFQVLVDMRAQRLLGWWFGGFSGLYPRGSALFTRPETYPTKTTITPLTREGLTPKPGDFVHRLEVTQLVGCRTHAPEMAASIVPFGEEIAEEMNLVYPPIWTEIKIVVEPNRSSAEVLGRSLFPSVSFYSSLNPSFGYDFVTGGYYDGVPNVDRWKTKGWGPRVTASGTSDGNPWNIKNPKGTLFED